MSRLLRDEIDCEVVGEADELEFAIHLVNLHHPDVLVLALSLADGSRIAAITTVRRRAPELGIVYATMEAHPAFAESALDAGALGYVLKDRADVELPPAVHAAAHGSRYVSPQIAGQLRPRWTQATTH